MERAAFDRLTERQRECLRLLARRFRAKEIAREIGISENTVGSYLTEAVRVLAAPGRAAAAAALLAHEAAHPNARGRFSVGDAAAQPKPSPVQPENVVQRSYTVREIVFPWRTEGQPNTMPWGLRLLGIWAQLILLILGIAIAVAAYSVYVKPLGDLIG